MAGIALGMRKHSCACHLTAATRACPAACRLCSHAPCAPHGPRGAAVPRHQPQPRPHRHLGRRGVVKHDESAAPGGHQDGAVGCGQKGCACGLAASPQARCQPAGLLPASRLAADCMPAGLLPASRLAVYTCRLAAPPRCRSRSRRPRTKPADPHRSPPCLPCRPGHLPIALGDLESTLRSIKLGGSSWMPFSESSAFPESWGNLTGLEHLDLSYGSMFNFSGAQPDAGRAHTAGKQQKPDGLLWDVCHAASHGCRLSSHAAWQAAHSR